MRALAVCFFLLAGFLPSTETTQDLRSRYGKPDVERFTVRAGMSITAEYGDDDLRHEHWAGSLPTCLRSLQRVAKDQVSHDCYLSGP